MMWKLLCLVGNLVSPLLNGLDEVLDDGSLGNLSDCGKAIGGSLGETKTSSWNSGSSSGNRVGNVGRSSGVVSGESDGRLGESDLGGSWEGSSIGSWDSRGGSIGSWGSSIGSWASSIGSWGSSVSTSKGTGVSSAVSSISRNGNSLREGGGHTGGEKDK